MSDQIHITQETYDKYLNYNYSPTTIKLYSWAFRKYYKDLLSEEGIENFLIEKCFSTNRNPLYMGFIKSFLQCFQIPYTINKPKKRMPKKVQQHKFIEKKKVDYLIQNLTPYYSMMVRILFETGLRRKELIDTKLTDINLSERTIKGIGKGNKEFRVKFSKVSRTLLREYLKSYPQKYPFHHGREKKDHLRSFYYHLKAECEDLGVEDVRPHRIRHALGHHLGVDKEMPITMVQNKLRHADIRSTSIYASATTKETDERIEREVFEK